MSDWEKQLGLTPKLSADVISGADAKVGSHVPTGDLAPEDAAPPTFRSIALLVIDRRTLRPIESAIVQMFAREGWQLRVEGTTDTGGQVIARNLSAGSYWVAAEAVDYIELFERIEIMDQHEIRLRLEPAG